MNNKSKPLVTTSFHYVCFTDGSSKGNPGAGGAGAIFADYREGKITEWGGFLDSTTNNAMELWAAIEALKWVHSKAESGDAMQLVTDSSYVVDGASKHLQKWRNGFWPEKNTELWKQLSQCLDLLNEKKIRVEWRRIPGHSGILANERADEIAQSFASSKTGRSPTALYSGKIESYFVPLNFESQIAGLYDKPKYLSLVDGHFSLDDEWGHCEARVKGNRSAKFKKVFNSDEVEWFMSKWRTTQK